MHDVTDWIGENKDYNRLNGFVFKAGRNRQTTGIWMWSEVFTHDFDNGDKVAIILLDTQGTFDLKSSMKECTTIFALSTMISSVQCYNMFHNIREDDLQHLQLFTDYASLVHGQTKENPFQYLLFILRDWSFPEFKYGWSDQLINETFSLMPDQTADMHALRRRIKSSFQEIGAFLMPHPGLQVARSVNFTGSIRDIDPLFVEYMKILAPGILAPENLVVKKINGERVKANELIEYIQRYMNEFNGDELPEPVSLVMVR